MSLTNAVYATNFSSSVGLESDTIIQAYDRDEDGCPLLAFTRSLLATAEEHSSPNWGNRPLRLELRKQAKTEGCWGIGRLRRSSL